MQMGAAI